MREETIRQRTADILSAYRDLTDTEYVPSLAEYLAVRKQAEEEIRNGVKGNAAAEPSPVPMMPEYPKETPAPVRVSVPAPDPPKKPRIEAAPKNIAVLPKEDPVPAAAGSGSSDFDILRSLADPWNS